MNGSRANSPRHGDTSSLDALNRTIEGLEARIEGLMAGGREGRARVEERYARAEQARFEPSRTLPLRDDPVSEIMQRQRALESSRDRPASRQERRPADDHISAREQAQRAYTAPPVAADPSKEIAQALVGLRQELKKDLSEGLTREMNSLRAEIRGIRQAAETHAPIDDIRQDIDRLAASITQIARQSPNTETDGLRVEFDELRSVLDGLAREDSVRRMEDRWSGVEKKLSAFDQGRDDELVALAYRLDELKTQIGSISATPAIRDLENKVHLMAEAVEALGRSVQPDDRRLAPRFEGLDARLDEISRAIAASGRTQATATADSAMMQRLEARIGDLAHQIDAIARRPAEPDHALGMRIEALAARMEELAKEEAALRLEERLDHLSQMLERAQKTPSQSADLTGYLTDISRKIDELDQGSVNDALAERLDYLARRIDEIEMPVQSPFPPSDGMSEIEGRLLAIADRLDRTRVAPAEDHEALRGLEAQIAHLSTLISQPQPVAAAGLPVEFESRMASIEEYMATNDEYIIEAARQAAEAVMEAYRRNGMGSGDVAGPDLAAISALADDLRSLEDLTRSSEERTARTFDALHETLVQIAGRLEDLDRPRDTFGTRREAAPAMPRAEMPVIHDDEDPFDADDFAGHAERDIAARQPMTSDDDYVDMHEPLAEDARLEPADDDFGAETRETVVATAQAVEPAAKKSLIAGLARRLVPGRKEQPAVAQRQQIDPAPSIDPGDEIAPADANQLLEPGSGGPDVRKILERVRAGQATAGRVAPNDGDKADFIAAARRAAKMAAEEADSISRVAPEKKTKAKTEGSALSRHRRPILMAVGAVLLAIMSYPLVNTLISGDKAPATAVVEKKVTEPAALPADGEAETRDLAATQSEEGGIDQQAAEADVAGLGLADDRSAATEAAPDTVPLALDAEADVASTGENATAETADGQTGADLLTRPAEGVSAADTAGFEPVDPAEADATEGASVLDEAAPSASVDTTAAAPIDAIKVPGAIAPASLAKAAGEGDQLALFELGARYTEGRGVPTDLGEASKWYKLAADRGFAPAQYRLGNLYEKGQGVERDLVKARALYEQAAEQGNASAMHNLAVLLATGGGADAPDFDAAAKWFGQAADLGVRDSQFNLAILYARGNGVTQDLEESYKWFAIAARDGDRDAGEKRDEVANAMRPEQLSSAKAKFDLWKAKPLDDKANSIDLPDEWAGPATKTASVDMKKAIRNIQAILNNNGFNAGPADGQMGAKTTAAIKAFQKSVGQAETGEIDDKLVTELLKRNK
jgi:localization factor PodJL